MNVPTYICKNKLGFDFEKDKKLLCSFLVVMVAMMFVISVPAKADEEDPEPPVNEYTMLTNNVWQSGTIGVKGQFNCYRITLPSAGYLTVDTQCSSMKNASLDLYDSDFVARQWSDAVYGASATDPKTKQMVLALEAGTYIYRVHQYYGEETGNYRIRASFQPSGATDALSHTTPEIAQALALNTKVIGFFTQNAEKSDYYKVYIPSKSILDMTFTNDAKLWYVGFTIFDKDLFKVTSGAEFAENAKHREVTLDPGTYYIKIYPDYSDHVGKYSFQIGPKALVTSIKVSGKKVMEQGKYTTLTAAVGPANAADKSVSWHSTNTSVLSVDSSGKVYTSGCGVAYIYAQANDEKQMKSNYHKIVVKPAKISYLSVSHYRYSSYYKKRMYVYHYGVNGKPAGYQIQYSTNQKFKNGTKVKKYTGSGGHYIGSLKKGKLYFVRVRAYVKDGGKTYYGPWSATKRARIYH